MLQGISPCWHVSSHVFLLKMFIDMCSERTHFWLSVCIFWERREGFFLKKSWHRLDNSFSQRGLSARDGKKSAIPICFYVFVSCLGSSKVGLSGSQKVTSWPAWDIKPMGRGSSHPYTHTHIRKNHFDWHIHRTDWRFSRHLFFTWVLSDHNWDYYRTSLSLWWEGTVGAPN